MKKRIACIVLAVLMLLTAFPVTAADSGVTVSLTVTKGDTIYTADGIPLAGQRLTVPYFDLSLYGLQDYYYDPACYTGDTQQSGTAGSAEGVVTVLHLLLFATEIYKCGLSPADAGQGYLLDSGMMEDYFSVSGNAGSAYLTLWDMQTNLNYFINRSMAFGREGWMATADQIALHSGDSVQIHGITGAASGTNLRYFRMGKSSDAATVGKEETVTLSLTHCATDFVTFTASQTPLGGETVYCTPEETADGAVRTWKTLGVTSKSGTISFNASKLGAGTFYIASAKSEDPSGLQNAPAVFRLTVEGNAIPTQPVPVTIGGMHEMQVQSVKLYAFSNGQKAGQDLLQGIAASDGQYKTDLVPGDFWLEGYDADGQLNGGLRFSVTESGSNTFTVQRIYDLHASNSGFKEDTDYAIYIAVTAPDGTSRHAAVGKADNYGTERTSCLFLVGDTVKASFMPLGDKTETYLPAAVEKTPTINSAITATIYTQTTLTVTAPAGSTISAGRFANYYLYTFYTPVSETTLPDGRVQASFTLPSERINATGSPNFFYRVQNPLGVTYWQFFDPSKTQTVEVTAQQLYLNSETRTSKTILHNYEQNTYDTADIYLNGTASGCVTLQEGETFSLHAFRNWMAIENFFNAKVALPDMHYRVIDENGKDSDLLTVTPDKFNSCQATVTANGSGTAILLVTYDAMFSEQAYKNGTPNQPNFFSAIWPENTGVLVFRIGDTGTIETNMTLNGDGDRNALDAEHDPLFYTGRGGASYTFTPEPGCKVSVAHPTVTDAVTYRGFSTDGVSQNPDGSVTLSRLLRGRNIVKIEKDGHTAYQIITARQISYNLLRENGEPLGTAPLHAGETVQIQYTGLVNPVEKMSGIYNHSARIRFTGEDGTVFTSAAGGAFGVYDFSGNPARQRIRITIPTYWQKNTYTLSGGCIAMAISGSAPGSHRGVSYGKGMDPNFNAGTGGALQGFVPDITLTLSQVGFLTSTLTLTDSSGSTVPLSAVTVEIKDADGNTTTVSADGTFPTLPGDYTYTIRGEGYEETSGTFTVTDSGTSVAVMLSVIETEPDKKDTFWQKLVRFLRMVWLWITQPVRFCKTLWQKLREKLHS